MKKLTIHSETVYLLAIVILAFAVATLSAADFGVSMIVAPSYILSLRFHALTFGQWEYVVQTLLFTAFCILMKRVKWTYFTAFMNGMIYGTVLDIWRKVVPLFNPAITVPGSMAMPMRIGMFIVGELLTALSVALTFRPYLYPQMADFFVKGVSKRFGLDRIRFKRIFDLCCLTVSCLLTLILFGRFKGIGVGTVIITLVNGPLIGLISKGIDRWLNVEPWAKRLSAHFDLSASN